VISSCVARMVGTPCFGIITIIISPYMGVGMVIIGLRGLSAVDGPGDGPTSVPPKRAGQFILAKVLSYMAGITSG
jgi:hypothetical protein